MSQTLVVDDALEATIRRLMETGTFGSNHDVFAAAVCLLEERETHLSKLNEALAAGLIDVENGRVMPADDVFAELRARYEGRRDCPPGD